MSLAVALVLLLFLAACPEVGAQSPLRLGDQYFHLGTGLAVLGDDLVVNRNPTGIAVFDATSGATLRVIGSGTGSATGLALLGTNVLVGVYSFPTARVLLLDSGTGTVLQTFNNPAPSANFTSFGMAVTEFAGNALIGDPGSDGDSGAAYLFDTATAAVLRTVPNPTPAPGDHFGAVVTVLGGNAVISAPLDDTAGTDAGAVYVVDLATGATVATWLLPAAGGRFGSALAVLGTHLLVGAPDDDAGTPDGGAVYLLDGTTGAVLRTFLPPAGAGNEFGTSVAPMGANVLVGAPSALGPTAACNTYIFDGATGAVLRTFPNPFNRNTGFGTAVAAVDGKVAIAAPGDGRSTDVGRVYVFCGGTAGCGPCETCGPADSCLRTRNPTCRQPIPAYSNLMLQLQKGPQPAGDMVSWTGKHVTIIWDAPDLVALGDPLDAAKGQDYSLCLFAGPTEDLVFRATVGAGSDCGGSPCWTALPRGYRYVDPARASDGIGRLKVGPFLPFETPKTAFNVRGRGVNLSSRPDGFPALPLALPVHAQVQVTDGQCFEASYPTAEANTTRRFKGRFH
jgi:hypothetical protein